jgi:hypothetical protein
MTSSLRGDDPPAGHSTLAKSENTLGSGGGRMKDAVKRPCLWLKQIHSARAVCRALAREFFADERRSRIRMDHPSALSKAISDAKTSAATPMKVMVP